MSTYIVTDLPTKRISIITVTKISRHSTYNTATKNGGHRYETKLRHCHPIYILFEKYIYILALEMAPPICREPAMCQLYRHIFVPYGRV